MHLHLLINEQDYAAAKNLSKNFIIISYSSKFGLSAKFSRKKTRNGEQEKEACVESKCWLDISLTENISKSESQTFEISIGKYAKMVFQTLTSKSRSML